MMENFAKASITMMITLISFAMGYLIGNNGLDGTEAYECAAQCQQTLQACEKALDTAIHTTVEFCYTHAYYE